MGNDYTIKQVGAKFYVFINLGNGYSFPLAGSHVTIEAAEIAFRNWKRDEDDKNEERSKIEPYEGEWS